MPNKQNFWNDCEEGGRGEGWLAGCCGPTAFLSKIGQVDMIMQPAGVSLNTTAGWFSVYFVLKLQMSYNPWSNIYGVDKV